MRVADIPQVLEIERESFPAMWPPTAFRRELQQNRLAHYIVVIENDSSRAPRAPLEPHEPERSPTGVGRLWGEIRQFLGVEDLGASLPPIEQRPELIIGFIGVWMLPDEAHIVTVAVRDSYRRQGIGELLLISAVELAQARGEGLITLECRVSNEPALTLYEKYGFQQVGLRPRYYSDNHEDAYVLTVSSVLTERFRRRFDELKGEHERRFGDFESTLR